MTPRIGSLFSGIGGFDLGAEQAGWTVAWQAEIEPQASGVLRRHWPEVENYGDVERLAGLPAVDAVCGGSPCQDLSTAGRHAGLAGSRSRLFIDLIRLADTQPAAALVWENVPGALSSNGGRDFATVLQLVTGWAPAVPRDGWRTAGFAWGPKRVAAWRVLDAAAFGVPQQRRRIILVGSPRTGPDPLAVLFDAEGGPGAAGAPAAPAPDAAVAPTLLGCGAGTARATYARYCVPAVQDAGAVVRGGNLGSSSLFRFAPVSYTLHISARHGVPPPEAEAVRRLTPRETERLQGFPDDWTRWDDAGRALPDRARYRMTGNAVAVPVAWWVLARLRAVLEGRDPEAARPADWPGWRGRTAADLAQAGWAAG